MKTLSSSKTIRDGVLAMWRPSTKSRHMQVCETLVIIHSSCPSQIYLCSLVPREDCSNIQRAHAPELDLLVEHHEQRHQ